MLYMCVGQMSRMQRICVAKTFMDIHIHVFKGDLSFMFVMELCGEHVYTYTHTCVVRSIVDFAMGHQ